MRARKTDTDLRQDQIAQAALDLIGAEGIHALSMAGIAQRVGIVPSALYRHYGGKDDVLDAVLNMLRNRMMNNVEAVCKETPDPLERLEALLMRHVRMLAENRAIPHVIFSDGIYAGYPERKAKVQEIMERYLARIEEIIREGRNSGRIRPDVVPKTASVLFLGMILPAAVLWNVTNGTFDAVAHARHAWPLFKRAICVRPEN